MLKSVLLVSISLVGCCHHGTVDDYPHLYQYAYAGNPKAFHGVHTKTEKTETLKADDPKMIGAQCLQLDDHLALEGYIQSLELKAQRCD